MNKKRYLPSPESSLLKGARYDSKDQAIMNAAYALEPQVRPFSIYDQMMVGASAVIFHYKGSNAPFRVIGMELVIADVGQSGDTFIDLFIKKRIAHLGEVPDAPYPLRAKREGNRVYCALFPFNPRGLGMELDIEPMDKKE